MSKVTDEYGLCLEGEHIVAYIPATEKAFVFWVKSRANRGFEIINYGPLPITSGTVLKTYDGTTATVPANGVIPARSYLDKGIPFPYSDAVFPEDMWLLPEEYKDRLFHVIQFVTPDILRIDVQIPIGVDQSKFQKEKVSIGVPKDFGFRRGSFEIIHLPLVRYGYRYGNDTNIDLRTFVRFVYAEYSITIPRNPELIFKILTRQIPSKWITIPIVYMDSTTASNITKVYGITGFPIYRQDEKDKAIADYRDLLGKVLV
jgi:hypothetical protein